MGGLGEYRRKRNAGRTPEPMPAAEGPLPTGNDDTFVIQEHHARRLHWDVRLERHGVLVSFAVPRGLPTEPNDIRLAVATEDHPMEYADFEGEIPRGEYGGGRMFIWDRGRYETVKWSAREIAVVFHGERVQGRYTFFNGGQTGTNWMVRRSEPPQRPDWEPLPEVLTPMLASPGEMPDGDPEEWAYEFKWDGVRALARVSGGRLQLISRLGNDVTSHYPELRPLGEELGSLQVWLDGEIVAFSGGKPSFNALQQRMHVANERQARRWAANVPVTYVIFDVLHLEGASCLNLPFAQRRALLEKMDLRGPNWLVAPCYPGEGDAVAETARERGMEGIIAKRLGSRYFPGRRTADWVKVTTQDTREVLIGGWRPGEGRRSGVFGSLLIGVPTEDGLRYVGTVGTGFTDEMLKIIMTRLRKLETPECPFHNEIPRYKARGARWVRPTLVGEVVFQNWTPDGRLRTPSWRGLRPDKRPDDVEEWRGDGR